jgi:hypothetical protein
MGVYRSFERFCERGAWAFFAGIWILFILQFIFYVPYMGLLSIALWILWGIGIHIPQKIYYWLKNYFARRKRFKAEKETEQKDKHDRYAKILIAN